MSALAELVAKGDPERFAAIRAAAPTARARLWPLYAFNLEIARAPYVTAEPMIAQMRLQFWRDVLEEAAEGAAPRAHEVAGPLAGLWRAADLPLDAGLAMIDARLWDIERAPFPDRQALWAHLDATGGALMWLAARALGAGPQAEDAVRAMGRASALANWLRAVPALKAAGRQPLPDESETALRDLAREGLAALSTARASRAHVPQAAAPALLAGWLAGPVLHRAAQAPARILDGQLEPSEFARRGQLLLRGLSGRW